MVCHAPRGTSSSNNKKYPIAPKPAIFKKKSSSSKNHHESHNLELISHCCHETSFPLSICMREHNEDHISSTEPLNAFTDGSYTQSELASDHRAGYAVFLHDHQKLARNVRFDSKISYTLNQSLPEFQIDLSAHKLSSMIVELLAILQAIDFVREGSWKFPSIYIYTDSLGSMQLLRKFVSNPEKFHRHGLKVFLAAIVAAAAHSEVKIHLLKVKAHSRIRGNEAADRLAYAAARAPPRRTENFEKVGGDEACKNSSGFPASGAAGSWISAETGEKVSTGTSKSSASGGRYEDAPGFVSSGRRVEATPSPVKQSPGSSSPAPASLQKMLKSIARTFQVDSPAKTPGATPRSKSKKKKKSSAQSSTASGDVPECFQELFRTATSLINQAAGKNILSVEELLKQHRRQHQTRSDPITPQQERLKKMAEKKNDPEPIYISDDDEDEFILISDDDDKDEEDDQDDDPVFISEDGVNFVEYIVLGDDRARAQAVRKTGGIQESGEDYIPLGETSDIDVDPDFEQNKLEWSAGSEAFLLHRIKASIRLRS